MNNCMICHDKAQEGIVIQKKYICLQCEQVIVTIDVDHPFYPLFVERMKEINAM